MFWKTPRLRCTFYEKGHRVELAQCSPAEITTLVNAVQELWKTPEGNDRWFVVEPHESFRLFRESLITIEISCYTLSPRSWRGKKQLSMKTISHTNPLRKRVKIQPRDSLAHKWAHPVEVLFQ